jgi:hypothetical protein
MLTDRQIQIVSEPLKQRGALELTVLHFLPLHFAARNALLVFDCSLMFHWTSSRRGGVPTHGCTRGTNRLESRLEMIVL